MSYKWKSFLQFTNFRNNICILYTVWKSDIHIEWIVTTYECKKTHLKIYNTRQAGQNDSKTPKYVLISDHLVFDTLLYQYSPSDSKSNVNRNFKEWEIGCQTMYLPFYRQAFFTPSLNDCTNKRHSIFNLLREGKKKKKITSIRY